MCIDSDRSTTFSWHIPQLLVVIVIVTVLLLLVVIVIVTIFAFVLSLLPEGTSIQLAIYLVLTSRSCRS